MNVYDNLLYLYAPLSQCVRLYIHGLLCSRRRLALDRAQDDFEQSVKGGFERVFPPSRTAPNAGRSYNKVVRVAEEVFAKLSGYRSPVHARYVVYRGVSILIVYPIS